MSRSGEGDEHIREALVGNILLVSGKEIATIALVYAVIGIFHFIFREKFLSISRDPLEASRKLNIRYWDFLFYASFGVVVTSSVKIAGVLLVFSFLVVPAACAVLFADRIRTRLILGWTVGFLGSVLGITTSYYFDLPTGASVVCSLGALILFLAVVKRVVSEI